MTARLFFGLVIILTINCCNTGQTKEKNKDMNQLMDNPNEKLIVVKGPKEEQMKKVLEGFCKMYNQNGSTTILKFYKKADDTFLITFPSDIDFELFCYLVNYIKYPTDIKYKVEAIGWTIADQVDTWDTKQINGKSNRIH